MASGLLLGSGSPPLNADKNGSPLLWVKSIPKSFASAWLRITQRGLPIGLAAVAL